MQSERTFDRGGVIGAAWFNKPWPERMAFITEMMREVSAQTVPQEMVAAYGRRMREILPSHRTVSLSRRDLEWPFVRITRSSVFRKPVNPWTQRDQLPVIKGGLLAELIYGDEAAVIDDLKLNPDDPAVPYLTGMRSLAAIPLFESGTAINMVVMAREEPAAYSRDFLPEHVWLSNLFGRATANLVLKEELREAYERLDRELQVVADIQRSLLPMQMPAIEGIDLASHYQTSRHAGGDAYDFFDLGDGKLGILISDVSGHGTPAAVMMAITHSIAHTRIGPPSPPSEMLNFINHHLTRRYTNGSGTFVTAFYGIYDTRTGLLTFANAGHNPPRLKRGHGGPNGIVEGDSRLPLGIDPDERYVDNTQEIFRGDTLVLYTDGITEARDFTGELFGTDRLDEVINHALDARAVIDGTIVAVDAFTGGAPAHDDRTMLVMRVNP